MPEYRTHCLICAGTACVSNRSFQVKEALERELEKQGLQNEIGVITTGCNGFCAVGPIMVVQPEGIFYQQLKVEDIPHLVEEHFLKGRPVKKLMYTPPELKEPIPMLKDIQFFSKQLLIALRNRGLINPENIDEYIARDGYTALAKVLSSMTPEQVIKEVIASGLRGRGGAGFPTGVKWRICREEAEKRKEERFIICNADEGDPGAFMDRSILEADPHSVIEGMCIGAYAMGSNQGYVYVRKEYPLALQRLHIAISKAKEYGLLGENIFDTDFSFDIEVHQGAGSFVCGEETALMASIMGRVAEPRHRPPYPAQSGLWGKPTNINNVETWANIPVIMKRGAKWFSSIGTGDGNGRGSKGTKVFSLVGKINNTGLVEVPMGITLREIVFDIGGGIPKGKKFKAVQTGGPSGGCMPESLLDLPIDFDKLAEVGSMMGSGGMIVMDEDTCMVDLAKYFVTFLEGESCGKCVPCREGLKRMREILDRITNGKGKEGDIELLLDLSEIMKKGALCGLGNTAPNPVLTTIRYFRDEYEAHIKDKKCPAGVCTALIEYSIDPDKCTGCLLCAKSCPSGAITGERKQVHHLDKSKCIKCGACYEVCRFDAVVKR
jgi:NADH:ubiquinone oxidoreductase subunit F (NADH-binding)/(2Fe-2S) ferredoxin/NAD-dependent dihydropyrimidine dehydrogenase PreA subunit